MASKQYVLTTEGLEKLETELDYLKSEKRQEIAEKIKEARGQGDLSENSEYDEAKNEQAQVEGRIAELENILKNAQVLDQDDIDTKEVSIGCIVKVKNTALKKDMEFEICGSAESDPALGRISDESPVGRALLGKKVNNKVVIETPAGEMTLKILSITRK
ncbi:MAG: transcription elongation factor GreA [Clostridia bacterium]|nr:transcription elongation factor GreA [Clostridia bacterium]